MRLRYIYRLVLTLLLMMLAGLSDQSFSQARDSKTFVLVHGAWVGEWYWEPLVIRLRKAGHIVFPVSLTGHGSRSGFGGPNVSLSDHAADITRLIGDNQLEDVYLVAHSYGGKPATLAWDINRERIHHVVYVDAFAPIGDGPEVIPGQPKLQQFIEKNFPDIAASGMMPIRAQMRQDLKDRSNPQSLKTMVDPVVLLNGPLPTTTLRTYVLATGYNNNAFKELAMQLRGDPGWTVLELKSGHDVMKETADQLATLLMSLD